MQFCNFNMHLKQIGGNVLFNFPVAKKLGGKLDVVSYHDDVEGEFFLKLTHIYIIYNLYNILLV